MTTAKVAVYVQRRYAKPAYKVESYNTRAWPGLEMVCDALRRGGVEVDYCSAATVGRYKIVLVSITSSCDWYPFLAERVAWRAAPTVIAGGAGVLNVRPFLAYVDVFCFGRAEDYIVPLVRAALQGNAHDHPSICYAGEFNIAKTYILASVSEVYPHEIRLANGKKWQERAIGCQRKCLFCGYTWHRRHVGGMQAESGAGNVLWGSKLSERTLFELDLSDPDSWDLAHLQMVGLDGFSERLRRRVNKPITRRMLRAFLRGLATASRPAGKMKIYNIVGYPTETDEDWREFAEDVAAADSRLSPSDDHRWGIVLHSTPFRAVPCTPAATWPMSYTNYRGRIAKVLRGVRSYRGNIFYEGNRLWCVESKGTESLATVVLEALVLRGTEADGEIMVRLAGSRKFANASMAHKEAILERYVEIDRLFRPYTWEDLPTRYLRSYLPVEKIRGADACASNEESHAD